MLTPVGFRLMNWYLITSGTVPKPSSLQHPLCILSHGWAHLNQHPHSQPYTHYHQPIHTFISCARTQHTGRTVGAAIKVTDLQSDVEANVSIMAWWRNNQAFVLHMSRSTLLFLRGVTNPLVFIKGPCSLYLVSSSRWTLQCGFIVKQSGLFRADYPKHVSSLQGPDGPLCHSASKPAVQSLQCTALRCEINTW